MFYMQSEYIRAKSKNYDSVCLKTYDKEGNPVETVVVSGSKGFPWKGRFI